MPRDPKEYKWKRPVELHEIFDDRPYLKHLGLLQLVGPLFVMGWLADWFLYLFDRSPLLRLTIQGVVAASVVGGVAGFIIELEDRREERADRAEERIIRAWRIVSDGVQRKTNVGQKRAVQFLIDKGEPLQGIQLENAFLEGVDFRPAKDLSGASFRGAMLAGADFSDLVLTNADFGCPDPKTLNEIHCGADLKGATLKGANLEGANLMGADLLGANFKGANLTRLIIHGPSLGDANLQGADLTYAEFRGGGLNDAKLQGADLSFASLPKADFTGANLQGAVLIEANLEGAVLSKTNLQGANLSAANLAEVKLLTKEQYREACVWYHGFIGPGEAPQPRDPPDHLKDVKLDPCPKSE